MTLRSAPGLTRSEARERAEDRGSNPTANGTIGEVMAARFGRRGFLKGALGISAATALMGTSALVAPKAVRAASLAPHQGFEEGRRERQRSCGRWVTVRPDAGTRRPLPA